MQNEIKKVCVIGSGIAALIANSSHKVVLLILSLKIPMILIK